MRLNFSGVDDGEIREGVRRIGKVISEQVELYGALTGEHQRPSAPSRSASPPADSTVVAFRKAGEGGR
jgi:2-aminoadipate transaminase